MKRREPLAGSRKPESLLAGSPDVALHASPACVEPAFRLPATGFRLPSSANHFDCDRDYV
jgi:hypothetical protein